MICANRLLGGEGGRNKRHVCLNVATHPQKWYSASTIVSGPECSSPRLSHVVFFLPLLVCMFEFVLCVLVFVFISLFIFIFFF